MSDIISGLLWNTCFAGGLAIVLFLAQQTRYLRIRPHVCHALWLLVLVKLISPTFFAVPVSIGWAGTGQEKNERLANTLPAIGNARSGIDEPIRPGVQGEEAMPAQTLDAMLTLRFAVAVSALGSLALLLTCLSRVRQIGRLVRHTEPASQWLQERVAVASRQMRLKRVPSIRIVHGTISPFLWGTWRVPRIILPSGLISAMEPESVDLIIKHELAHYARRDHWTNSFATTLTILFWWNPVVWWARRELRIQQEWCCDRMVLAQDRSQSVRYAETLLAAVDFVASNAVTYPSPATTFGSCSTLQRRVEMIVSQNPLPITTSWASVFLFALLVLPFGIANAEEKKKDWSAEHKEFVERIEEFTGEIEELRNEGEDSWAKHLIGRRDYLKSILPKLDEIAKLEQAIAKAQGEQDFDQIEQLEDKLESLVDKFWRAERIGEMEGRLDELNVLKGELAEEGDDNALQRVKAFVADQVKLLEQVRELHKIVETDDEQRIEKIAKQVDQREESLLLRIEEFHLERHTIEARQEGEDVQELEAELKKVRKSLREFTSDSR
jgi:beta-lactamase regulating signal transducer with metallopeptidase domain